MRVVIDPEIMSGPLVDTLTGIPGAKVKAVIMEINGQAWEFLQLIEPPSKPFSPPYAQPGRGHICFEVTDIHEAYEKLKGKGGTLVCPPQEFPELKMFYFEDPEGNRIEFVEMR
jgi:catechol 2,3-dioxygenase-like lactoylglutathione lyase family enzyme